MKLVSFMCRERAEQFEPPENAVIISINTPGNPRALLSDKWAARCDWDRADDDGEVDPIEVYNIMKFVEAHQDKTFFVHCDAGISRSAAVALAVGILLDQNVIGLDCMTTIHANAVIKAAFLRPIWEKHF